MPPKRTSLNGSKEKRQADRGSKSSSPLDLKARQLPPLRNEQPVHPSDPVSSAMDGLLVSESVAAQYLAETVDLQPLTGGSPEHSRHPRPSEALPPIHYLLPGGNNNDTPRNSSPILADPQIWHLRSNAGTSDTSNTALSQAGSPSTSPRQGNPSSISYDWTDEMDALLVRILRDRDEEEDEESEDEELDEDKWEDVSRQLYEDFGIPRTHEAIRNRYLLLSSHETISLIRIAFACTKTAGSRSRFPLQLTNDEAPWREDEDDILTSMRTRGIAWERIGLILGRSVENCQERWDARQLEGLLESVEELLEDL
jgi:hypothetical protein